MPLFRKQTKDRNREITLCPRCKKPISRQAHNVSGWLSNPIYKCNECGYSGIFHIVAELDESGNLKEPKDLELDDIVAEEESTE